MPSYFRRLLFTRAVRLFDLSTVSLTFVAAVGVSSGTFSWPSLAEFLAIRIKIGNILIFIGYLVACSAIFSICGFYLSHRLSHWTRQAGEIFAATTLITIIFSLLPREMVFATKEFLLVFWLINFCVLGLARLVAYRFIYYMRSRGRNLRNLVVVGEGVEAMALANRIENETTLGYRVLHVIDTKETGTENVERVGLDSGSV